jgi:hypothetical protein
LVEPPQGLSPEQVALLKDAVDLGKIVLPAAITLLAGNLAYRFALRQERERRKLAFIERQISDFYSPLLGWVKRTKASTELRTEIGNAADTAWQKTASAIPPGTEDSHFAPFAKVIEYNNLQLKQEILPLYSHMLDTFTANHWLAEESTRAHYPELVRFVDVWQRFIADAVPGPVLKEIRHSEEGLEPLYSDLEAQLARLRARVASGK